MNLSNQSKAQNLLGAIIQYDMKWDQNTDAILRKVQKWLYVLKRLMKARASTKDMLKFYTSIIRPVCEYAASASSSSLAQSLKEKLESVQKRVFTIIFPYKTYGKSCK